jgi:hypothetical protein
MKWLAIAFILSSAGASVQYDVPTIIQRSVHANNADWNAAPAYHYFERDQENRQTKTYKEIMILGSPYEYLVAVDGNPLLPERQAVEQQKLEAVIVERQKESPQERAQRIARYEKQRKRDHLLMQQLTKAFDFKPAMDALETMGREDVNQLPVMAKSTSGSVRAAVRPCRTSH